MFHRAAARRTIVMSGAELGNRYPVKVGMHEVISNGGKTRQDSDRTAVFIYL